MCSSETYKYNNYDKTKHKVSPLLLDSPGKSDHQAIHYATANVGPLSRGSVTDPKLTRSLGLNQDPSNSECSALTHFSTSLARKCINLKEPCNQDIKE